MSRFLLIDGANKGKFVEAEYSHPHQDHLLFHEGIEENYQLYLFKSNDGKTYFIGSVSEYDPAEIERLIRSS